jgi:hypothetical protein
MPPRYAYWTILVDEQPTAFRSAMQDELQPTFSRLKAKHPSARMVWFQNGKVWGSRLEAQEAMRMRGERGRKGDFRQRRAERPKLEWKPKSEAGARPKLEWKPKPSGSSGSRIPAPGSRQKPSTGEPRDRNWRPGGEHKDPRQKYKDAKKAKWTRFKQTVRKRWEGKQTRKKKDEE